MALFWLGRVANAAGAVLLSLALPYYLAVVLIADPPLISIVMTGSFVAALLSPLYAGVLADLLNRQRICVAAELGRFGLVLILAILVMGHTRDWALLFVINFFIAACGSIVSASLFAGIADFFEEHELTRANSRLQVIRTLADSAGSAGGGFLLAQCGAFFGFLVAGASFLLSALGTAFIRWPRASRTLRADDRKIGYVRRVSRGFEFAISRPLMRDLLLSSTIANVAIGVSSISLLWLLVRDLEFPFLAYASILGVGSVGAVTGAILARSKRLSTAHPMSIQITALLLYGALLGAYSVLPPLFLGRRPHGVGHRFRSRRLNFPLCSEQHSATADACSVSRARQHRLDSIVLHGTRRRGRNCPIWRADSVRRVTVQSPDFRDSPRVVLHHPGQATSYANLTDPEYREYAQNSLLNRSRMRKKAMDEHLGRVGSRNSSRTDLPYTYRIRYAGCTVTYGTDSPEELEFVRMIFGPFNFPEIADPPKLEFEVLSYSADGGSIPRRLISALEPSNLYGYEVGRRGEAHYDPLGDVTVIQKRGSRDLTLYSRRRRSVHYLRSGGDLLDPLHVEQLLKYAMRLGAMSDGYLPLHSSAWVSGGGGVVVAVGDKGAGKSTLMLNALGAGARYMSNDGVFVRRVADTDDLEVVGWPNLIRIADGTLSGLPHLRDLLHHAGETLPRSLHPWRGPDGKLQFFHPLLDIAFGCGDPVLSGPLQRTLKADFSTERSVSRIGMDSIEWSAISAVVRNQPWAAWLDPHDAPIMSSTHAKLTADDLPAPCPFEYGPPKSRPDRVLAGAGLC
ncbi:MFS transporter [Microbacterium sp. EST19A]|uniref:MFS transporter n=1 Tax=Microbacterium sp. EST19A TaxID=2862681 RepID=UPI001CBE08C2|nr:MFS transporter [Microbacterium sp. EST19A]